MTPLRKYEALCQQVQLPKLRIKDEGVLLGGTWKDRRSQQIIQEAQAQGSRVLCLLSYGNAVYSLGLRAQSSGEDVRAVMPKNTPMYMRQTLQSLGVRVVIEDLQEKELQESDIFRVCGVGDPGQAWDVTNGFHGAYAAVVQELGDDLPEYLICPLGSGEAFVGMAEELQRIKSATKIIGVTVDGAKTLADKLYTRWSPYEAKIQELKTEGHEIITVNDQEVHEAYQRAGAHMVCEPSAAVALHPVLSGRFSGETSVVVINSGKGLYV
jgi:threonine dehydratase